MLARGASRLVSPRHFSTSLRMSISTRTETDAFGPIEVESDKYWGAQTQRSLGNFKINQPQDRMPEGVVRAFGILKGAAATVNMRYGLGKRHHPSPRRLLSLTSIFPSRQTRRSEKPFSKRPPRLPLSNWSITSPSSSGKRALGHSPT